MLQARLAGADLEACQQAEWRRGTLPPRNLGKKQVDAVADEVDRLAAVARRHVGGEQRTVDTVVHLDGCRVTGTVTGVRATTVTRVTFGRMQAKYQLRAWLQLLALAAGHPEHAWDAVVVARGDDDQDATVFALRPVDPDTARDHLADLVRLRAEGLCTPLPLPAKTAARYAAALLTDRRTEPQALGQARKVWEDGNGPENGNDAAHDLVWGTRAGFDALLDAPAAHRRDVGSRFAELALEVWEPLLAHVRRVPA
jgi:exodeoxyribonuclease V gamma subunit